MNNRLYTSFTIAALGACTMLLPARASIQDSAPHIDTGSGKMMKSPDTLFAIKAAQGGLAEVQLGRLALEKSSGPDVKAFGQQMVTDHTKANEQLKSVTQKQRMTLPESLDPKDQALYSKLQNLSGIAFGKAYMKAMVKDHKKDIKEFQKEADHGRDADIKSFASQTLPVLQSHLEHARTIEVRLGR